MFGIFAAPVAADDVVAGIDPWKTKEPTSKGLDVCPIPADFFGRGSDPFSGTIQFQGKPFGGALGDADTIVERLANAILPVCSPLGSPCGPPNSFGPPPCSCDTVPIEIVALSLKSTDPIIITFNGGQDPEEWNVEACLSDAPQPVGSMTILHNCPEGGTFSSTVKVLYKLIFRRPGEPTFILDAGLQGCPPLDLSAGGNWVHAADPGLALRVAPGQQVDGNCDGVLDAPLPGTTNFFPGIEAVPCIECCEPMSTTQVKQDVSERAPTAEHTVTPPGPGPGPFCGDNVVNQPTEVCDGTDDAACPGQCLPNCKCPDGNGEPIPTVSQWGLIVLALLLLVGAKVYYNRRWTATA